MEIKLLAKLTPQILAGAESLGIDHRALQVLLGVNRSQYATLSQGSKRLSAAQVRSLEDQTGRTVSVLAVLGIAHRASPQERAKHTKMIEDTCELMAKFDRLDRKRPTKQSASRPKLPTVLKPAIRSVA